MFDQMVRTMRELGADWEEDPNEPAIGVPDDEVTTLVEVHAYATRSSPRSPRTRVKVRDSSSCKWGSRSRRLMGVEAFLPVRDRTGAELPEDDVFSGLGRTTQLRSTNRTEAFSDGVMAIAVTLLISTSCRYQLRRRTRAATCAGLSGQRIWRTSPRSSRSPSCGSTTTRFRQGCAHRQALGVDESRVAVDRSVVPFPTAVVAEYVQAGGIDAKVAVSTYGLVSVLNGGCWMAAWHHLSRHPHLLHAPFDGSYALLERRRTAIRVSTYAVATAIAWLVPVVALLLYLAMAVFYAATSSGSQLAVV